MGQIMAVVVIMIMIAFVFVPLAYYNANHLETEEVKQSLNLGAKTLVNCIEQEAPNLEEVGKGYERTAETDINIDKDRLLREFKKVVELNCFNRKEKYEEIEKSILAKVLVYHDRFYIADKSDRWSTPYYFSTVKTGMLLYLNTANNMVVYYDSTGNPVIQDMSGFGITEKEKNEIIINKINRIVAQYTSEPGERTGLSIQIRNPGEQDVNYRVRTSHLNVLGGITFFVVYAENNLLNIDMKDFRFKNYNVVGYTLQ